MADRSPPDRLNIASFKQRKVCVEIDRIGPDGPPAPGDETLEEVTGDIRTGNSAITEDLERQEVERENLSATAADPEGGRRAAAHVGDGAREVAATRSCVTNVC